MDTPAHDNFAGTMNGAGGANLATNAGGGAQPVEGQLAPALQQLWTQQQAAPVPAAADTMQMMLAMQQSMTQSMQSIQKMVEGNETLLKRVLRQMPFLCFVRYIYPRNIPPPLATPSSEWTRPC